MAGTSFFPAKPLGCYGDGGMIFTDSKEMLEQLLSIRVHGQGADKYTNVRVGINGRMDSLQAAVLLAKMEIFPEEIELRQEVAARYDRLLAGAVKTPEVLAGKRSAWAQYSVLHPRRDEIIKKLRDARHPHRHLLPHPPAPAGGLRRPGLPAGAISRSPKRSPARYSACPCTPTWKKTRRRRSARSFAPIKDERPPRSGNEGSPGRAGRQRRTFA